MKRLVSGLARTLVAQNKDEEVTALLEPIDSEGPFAAESQRIKSTDVACEACRAMSPSDEAALRSRSRRSEERPGPLRAGLPAWRRRASMRKKPLGKCLLSAGERDMKLATTKVREAMVPDLLLPWGRITRCPIVTARSWPDCCIEMPANAQALKLRRLFGFQFGVRRSSPLGTFFCFIRGARATRKIPSGEDRRTSKSKKDPESTTSERASEGLPL